MATKIETDLLTALKHGSFKKEHLNELVTSAAAFHDKGAKVVGAFPIGIPNPDSLQIETISDAAGLGHIVDILTKNPRIVGVEVFPKGILNPEIFLTTIKLR